MISTSILRAQLVAAIRGISDVVAELNNDPENVVEYIEKENGDLYSTVNGRREPALIVVYTGFHWSGHQMTAWQRNFSIFVKAKGDPADLVEKLLDGVTTASGFPAGKALLYLVIHPAYNSMNMPNFERRSIVVDEKTNYDFWELTISFSSRGAQ